MVWRRYNREMLVQATEGADSINDVLRNLKIPLAGGSHAHISKLLNKYDVDTSHFTRSRRHLERTPRRDPLTLLVRRPPGSPRVHGSNLKRALLLAGVPELCDTCGLGPEWAGRPLVLQVDHIDGDPQNNEADNLRMLCPNCHSQCPTFSQRVNTRVTATEPQVIDSRSARP